MFVAVYQVNGFVIIVIIVVFMVMDDGFMIFNRFEKEIEIIILWYQQFAHIAATQAIIIKNVMTEVKQLFRGFVTGKQGNAVPVFADDSNQNSANCYCFRWL